MIRSAIAQMATECEKKPHLIPIEEYLTSICTTNEIAEKIKNKTLKDCFEHMKKIARKRAVNNCAYIPPEEGFEIIRKFYGIEEKQEERKIDILDFL